MSLVHQAGRESHSYKENLQIYSRLRPFQHPQDHWELALFLLTQQPAIRGGSGSKHAFLLLWGDFAQSRVVKTLLSSPQKEEVVILSQL